MAIPPDPNDPTRADLPPVPPAGGDPTAPMPRATTGSVTGTEMGSRRPPPADEGDRRRAWWLWALLALVLVGIVLWALLGGDDDDVDAGGPATETSLPVEEGIEDPAAQAPDDALAEEADDGAGPAPTEAPDTTEAPADDAPDEAADTGTGTVVTSDGTDVLTLVQGDEGDAERLAPHAGSDVEGTGVEVLEVVDGVGFWIGVDYSRRFFAHAVDDPATPVEVGQLIDFDGVLAENPPAGSAEAHELPEGQGAELHALQGHHLELGSVTPVG